MNMLGDSQSLEASSQYKLLGDLENKERRNMNCFDCQNKNLSWQESDY